jgi:iron complex transport system substrate-binding protein
MRIVSLLPAATEMVCGLGLADQLVGVSHECDYPAAVQRLPKVTRTRIRTDASSQEIDAQVREELASQRSLYSLDIDAIGGLRPELIVTQTLCNVCAVSDNEIQSLLNRLDHRPLIVDLAPTRLADIFDGMRLVARAADIEESGERWIEHLQARVQSVVLRSQAITVRPRVVLLEWLEPLFCAGHWSPELVRLAGGQEMIGREGEVSRRIGWDDLYQCDPDVLVIACCGFDTQRTVREFAAINWGSKFESLRCVREHQTFIVDGNAYFNRPGPRLIDSLELLAHLFHPEIYSLSRDVSAAVPLSACKARSQNRLN